jgi:hypothetical protein
MTRIHLPLIANPDRRLALLKAMVQVRTHTRADGATVQGYTREQQTAPERAELVDHLARTLKAGGREAVQVLGPADAHRTAVAIARKNRKPVHLHHARDAWRFSHRKPPGRACHEVHRHHTVAHAAGEAPRKLTHRQAREALKAAHQPPPAPVPGAETTRLAHVYHHVPGSHTLAAVEPGRIEVDPGAYQHRAGANARGEVRAWDGPEAWDPAHSYKPVLLHRRRNGKLYMVDGHHRLAQAHRLLKAGHALPPMNAVILSEKDGYTPAHMRAINALAAQRSDDDAQTTPPQGPAGAGNLPAGAGGPDTQAGWQPVGAGNTGTVYRDGAEVVKRTVTTDGARTAEGDVYDALRGTPGIAPGYRDGDAIRLPHYPTILSTDAVPAEARARHAAALRANAPRLNAAVHALSEAGYNYADPLQAGLDADGTLHLLDFSNAHRRGPADLTHADNNGYLQAYYRAFGLDDLAAQVGAAHHARRAMGAIAGAERELADVGLSEDELAAERDLTAQMHGAHIHAHHDRMRRELAGEPRYSYVGTAHPGKLPIGTTHVEAPGGHHVVLAAHPLDAEAIARHGLLPVEHPAVTPEGGAADAMALARLEALHQAEQGQAAPVADALEKGGLGADARGLSVDALLDMLKALIQVKAHTRRDGTQVRAHTRNIQSRAERQELVDALARRMAEGDHTRHATLASAVGAARHASKVNGKAVHVYEHAEGGWVATHDASHTEGHDERIVAVKGRARLHRAGEASRSLAHLKGPIAEHVEKPAPEPRVKKPRPKVEKKPALPDTPAGRLAGAYLATAHESRREAESRFYELLEKREASGEKVPTTGGLPTYYNDATGQFLEALEADMEAHGGEVSRHVEAAGFRLLDRDEASRLAQAYDQSQQERAWESEMARYTPQSLADEYEAHAGATDAEARENYSAQEARRAEQGAQMKGAKLEFMHAETGRAMYVADEDSKRMGDELLRRGWRPISWEEKAALSQAKREERKAAWTASTLDEVMSGRPGRYSLWRGQADKREGAPLGADEANHRHLNILTTSYTASGQHAGKPVAEERLFTVGGRVSKMDVELRRPFVGDAAGLESLRAKYLATNSEIEKLQKEGVVALPAWLLAVLKRDGFDAFVMGKKDGAEMAVFPDKPSTAFDRVDDFKPPAAVKLFTGLGLRITPQEAELAGLASPITMTATEWGKHLGVKLGSPRWGTVMRVHRDAVVEAVKSGAEVPRRVKRSVFRYAGDDRPVGLPAGEVRTRLTELQKQQQAERSELERRRKELGNQILAHKGGAMHSDPGTKWDDTYRNLVERETEMCRESSRMYRKHKEEQREAVMCPEKLEMVVSYDDHPEARPHHETWRQAVNQFARMVGPRPGVHCVQMRYDESSFWGDRASYSDHGLCVNLKGADGDIDGTIVHELGHWFEVNAPEVLEKAIAFHRRRTEGEKWVTMNEAEPGANYHETEHTKVDNFFRPYVGKLYGDYLKDDGKITATEIVSMGIELMWRSPSYFAETDPDYFDFIWGLLRRTK